MSNWINVNEYLPSYDQSVDVIFESIGGKKSGKPQVMENCYFDAGEDKWWFWSDNLECALCFVSALITHWKINNLEPESKESHWIDAHKILPNASGKIGVGPDVLIFNNRVKKIFIACRVFISRYSWVWVDDDNFHHSPLEVTRWLPLPEVPNDN